MIAKVVFIGIILVFLILLLLTILLTVFPLFFSKKKTKIVQNVLTENSIANNIDDYTLISVITAAIAVYRENNNECGDLSSFKVVAFRKANRRQE